MPFRRSPRIAIDLDRQSPNLVSAYSTGDSIYGTATVCVDHEVPFDDIDITFEGTSRTSVERASVPGQSGAYQTFLKLRQPIPPEIYPTPRTLQPNHPYTFPFTFVIPERLLPQACSHSKNHGHLQCAHTLLPPTLGDPIIITRRGRSDGKKEKKNVLLNDMSPDMCRIAYFVRASVLKKGDGHREGSGKRKVLGSAGKKVRIMPAVEEEPPVNLEDREEGDGYCSRREKDVRRGWTRSKRGRVVVAAAQPRPIELVPGNDEKEEGEGSVVSSVATLQLRFDPVDEAEQPPSLGTVGTKLTASTFFSAHPWTDFPAATRASSWAQLGRGMYIESVPLSTRCVASATWTRHDDNSRRDSLRSTSSSSTAASHPGPSAAYSSSIPYYTAAVVIPITLPRTRTLIPTFHSCLISRIYSLDLSVSYKTTNTSFLGASLSLKIPIQVTSCGFRNAPKDLGPVPATEAEGETETEEEVEAQFFTPRNVGLVAPRQGAAVAVAPPAYGDYRPRMSSVMDDVWGVRTACA